MMIELFGIIKIHLPLLQLDPIQPAWQLHFLSVGLHVLQLDEQTSEQFWPWNPSLQARRNELIYNEKKKQTKYLLKVKIK